MKGVVRPQAMPTRRKPRVQFRIEGVGGGGSVAEEAMVVVGDKGEKGAIAGGRASNSLAQ